MWFKLARLSTFKLFSLSVGEDVKKEEDPYIAGRDIVCYQCFGKWIDIT